MGRPRRARRCAPPTKGASAPRVSRSSTRRALLVICAVLRSHGSSVMHGNRSTRVICPRLPARAEGLTRTATASMHGGLSSLTQEHTPPGSSYPTQIGLWEGCFGMLRCWRDSWHAFLQQLMSFDGRSKSRAGSSGARPLMWKSQRQRRSRTGGQCCSLRSSRTLPELRCVSPLFAEFGRRPRPQSAYRSPRSLNARCFASGAMKRCISWSEAFADQATPQK